MEKIILASKSPRRHEILSLAGISHVVMTAETDESAVKFTGDPADYVKKLAKLKSDALISSSKFVSLTDAQESIVISADTIVYSERCGEPLGKPKNFDDAFRMLSALSGTSHEVLTGVCLYNTRVGSESVFAESTKVNFRPLSDLEITRYIESAKPYDKAGAYGIQESACVFISSIEGDFYNVMGLPVCRIYREIFGI